MELTEGEKEKVPGRGERVAHGTLVDVVTRALRDAIVEGRLQPGERIRQEAVAREFGTSRIPVREALRQLQSEGLVTLSPNVGARVARLDVGELVEVYLVRERLEPLALLHAATGMSAELLDALRGYEVEMEAASKAGDKARWLTIDTRFHRETYEAAAMPRLMRLIDQCWDSTHQYRHVYVGTAQRYALAEADHRIIIESLARGDGEGAATILQMHIRRVRLTLLDEAEIFDS